MLAKDNQQQPNTNPLGTEPILHLIGRYAIPTSLTLMVNYLYNIVDQIFVGQGVGIAGMAATNVAFPMTILAIALALLLGDGCAANVSLFLGRKDQETAERIVSHTMTLLVLFGFGIAVLSFFFAPQIVRLFGATETAFRDSLVYLRTIAFGLPFLMFSSALTAMIRADGTPQYTMKCMMVGCAMNLVLDPVFIFLCHWGVFGAGFATVLGQAVTGIGCFWYWKKPKTVRVRKAALWPTRALTLRILSLGIPSLCTQLLTALVQITMNNFMSRYGAQTVYGGDIALSVYGMMMKVYQIAHSMFVGVSSATQPIHGYNFGAKQYDRVRQTYGWAVKIGLTISVAWFLVYQFGGRWIAALFVSDEPLYLDCAAYVFRIYMAAFFLYGLHMVTASFLQGIGKPQKALCIPVVRQAVVLIPAAFLLSARFGMDGALWAAPMADVVVFLVAAALAIGEFRSWKKQGLGAEV